MSDKSSPEDVIVWALEQRTFARTPARVKARTIMQEFAFNGYEVVKVAESYDRAAMERLRRNPEMLKRLEETSSQIDTAVVLDLKEGQA